MTDISMLKTRELKYGYSNVRVRGMKGLLLTQQFLDELISVRAISAMAELLQRTHYKEDINYYSLKYRDSAVVELAAIRHFGKIARKIKKFAPSDDIEIINALLMKWDLLNLKMIINAKRIGKTFEEIRPYLINTGTINESDYERIAKADEMELFEEIKKTSLGEEMLSSSTEHFNRSMFDAFRSSLKSMDKFFQLQTILDAYIYLFMDKGLKSSDKDVELVRKLLRLEIDAKNILLIERLKAHGVDKKKIRNFLIKGGTLFDLFIEKLIEADDLKKTYGLLQTRFPKLIARKSSEKECSSLTDLEIILEKVIAYEKVKTFHQSILSIGVLLGFLLLKEEEVNNLRKIAKAKEFGVSEQDIKEILVIV